MVIKQVIKANKLLLIRSAPPVITPPSEDMQVCIMSWVIAVPIITVSPEGEETAPRPSDPGESAGERAGEKARGETE